MHAKKTTLCGMKEKLYECMYEQRLCACISTGKFYSCFYAKWKNIDCAFCCLLIQAPRKAHPSPANTITKVWLRVDSGVSINLLWSVINCVIRDAFSSSVKFSCNLSSCKARLFLLPCIFVRISYWFCTFLPTLFVSVLSLPQGAFLCLRGILQHALC